MRSDNVRLIELKLRDISQLFNSMDPSPFHEKDLDHDAEEFIVSWAQEYPSKDPLKLKIYLDQWPAADPEETARQSVHNYFSYRRELAQRDFRHLMKQARVSLFIGLIFLGACLLASGILLRSTQAGWAHFLKEGLTIAGWVAMWRPIQLYLYDWWPVHQQIGTYERLSRMTVEVAAGKTKV